MKKTIILTALLMLMIPLHAQSDKQKDKQAIKSMCGCFEVKFNFAEVYSPDLGYELKKPYQSQATELVVITEEDEDMISMQHVLQVSEEMIIKHWRQEWNYEDTQMMQYNVASNWETNLLNAEQAENTWTQQVFQVDDSPRYEGVGTWIHKEDESYWEGASDSPLPRRDLTKRDDYNVMNRRNRHVIHSKGHTHEEDNTKIDRSRKYGDEVVAIEKGYNTYTRVDDSRCQAAIAWWEKNQLFWKVVRTEWSDLLDNKDVISLDFEDGKNGEFYMAMFGLGEEHVTNKKFKTKKARKAVRELMESYLIEITNEN